MLQTSGKIDLGDLNLELTNSETAPISLGGAAVRNLTDRPTGKVSLSDAYGKFYYTLPVGGTGGTWVPITSVNWGTFMNNNAIWNQTLTFPTVQTFESPIYFPVTGTYTIEYSADNLLGFAFDTGYVKYSTTQSTGAEFTTSRTITQSFTNGMHTLYASVMNDSDPVPDPWGIAITIKDPGNNTIWTTRNTNFQNGNFSTGNLVVVGSTATIGDTWTVQLTGTNLDGVDTILGWPTPDDNTFPWPAMSGEKDIHNPSLYSSYGTYAVSLSNDVPAGSDPGTKSILLSLGNDANPAGQWFSAGNAYGTTRGPYFISQQFVTITANHSVSFWWRAAGTIDAYDVHAYIVEIYTGATITILDASGQTTASGTAWQQVTTVVPTTGIYKFVFVNGSWDATGGLKTGAELYITRIVVT